MAFTLQDDTGLIVDANAYVSVAEYKAYFADLNNEDATDLDDVVIQAAIIKATQYIDNRFCFKGLPLNSVADGQCTQFPRSYLYDARGDLTAGLPKLLKNATIEYSLRAVSAELAPDPETDTRGKITMKRELVVGAVEEETHFAEGIGAEIYKPYPKADAFLAQFISSGGGSLARG
jgi:hypothetical protein